ncbi:MAG: dethiobiotin synthase [Tepidisphaeraceae bacterium]|jgi:dethiobiotin synthetase
MLKSLSIPGLFITGTDTAVGKTFTAAAIADWFVRRKFRVAVSKPAATGCVHRREGLVSEDAEFLAQHADAKFPLHVICPQRFAEPLAPAVAAEREGKTLDWKAIQNSLDEMSAQSDMMIVEGVGGIMTPMDRKFTVLDMAEWLGLPTIVVARAGLGTISHTLLTLMALRSRKMAVAGVVIDRYPAETQNIAEETNPRAIEKWGKVSVLCMIPEFSGDAIPRLPKEVVAAVEPVDWGQLAGLS